VPTLPPTVHERLARCGTEVLVTSLATGADVDLDVGGAHIAFTATGPHRRVPVPSLAATTEVRARQDLGSGFSAWSPSVFVEDADVPPAAPPRLPIEVSICSHCVRVDGAVPGSRIELRVGPTVVGGGTADRHGGGCFGTDLERYAGDPPDVLTAIMEVCGSPSPPATTPLVAQGPLSAPSIAGPLFACQRVVPVREAHPGARIRLEDSTGSLGWFCSCWTAVNVHVFRELAANTSVRAQPYWDGRGSCTGPGPWSAWEPVVEPDERIAPVLGAPLVEGDRMLRVSHQIVGGTIMVNIRPPGAPVQHWGPVQSSDEVEVGLAEPLLAGSRVTVTQTLCTFSATSNEVIVDPLPPEVFAPTIVDPVHACGASVQVSNLHPGALVRVYSGDIPIGVGWAGMSTSIAVAVSPSLVEGREVTATQRVGSVTSGRSDPVTVIRFGQLHVPRVLAPVANGDRRVWVSGLTPGCRVQLTSGGNPVAVAYVAEPVARIPVWPPVDGPVIAELDLCGDTASSDRVIPVDPPEQPGPYTTATADLSFPGWPVPATADGDPFTTEIRGELYFPADGGEIDPDQVNLPAIVLAHGFWDREWFNPDTGKIEAIESFRGYDYLGHQLASWGMLVYSIAMDDVNDATRMTGKTHQYARGEIVLHALDELIHHPTYGQHIDPQRLGILGHSMSGEGVVAAQQLNRDGARGYSILGVVSLAPTRWRPELVASDTDYLQLYGSMDQLNGGAVGPAAPFAGVRFYDDAARPKTHAWVHGARHNPFNRRWVGTTDFLEDTYADAALPPGTHELVARCLLTAFFLRSVAGRTEYAGYMEGTVLPASLDNVAVHLQHSRAPRTVIDNFGDEDQQAGQADEPLDPATNTLNLAIDNVPAGSLGPFDDVELINLDDCSHDTKGVRFAWSRPGAAYRTGTGGLAAVPTGRIALRTAQFYDDTMNNPPGLPADLFVRLEDGSGASALVRLGAVAAVPYPDHDLANDAGPDPLAMLKTIGVPVDAFTAAAPGLAIGNLQRISLVMTARATGHLILDDIELWG
jgi:hypothetical protein